MKAHPFVLSKTLNSLLSTCSILVDRKLRVMAAKMLLATQNINTPKKNQLKITKETFISNFCCSCVRLLVHMFTLVCYMKIFALKILSMKMFIQILFVWQENDLVFSYEFEKMH